MWRWYIVDRTQASGHILQNIWLEHRQSDNILSQRRHDHSCGPTDLLSLINCSHVRTGKGEIYCWLCQRSRNHLKNLNLAKKTQFHQVLQSLPLLLAPVLPCPLLFTVQRSRHLFSHSPFSWHIFSAAYASGISWPLSLAPVPVFNRPWKATCCHTARATSWRPPKKLHSSTLKILCCSPAKQFLLTSSGAPLPGCPQHLWAHVSQFYLLVNLCGLAVMKNQRR